MNIKDLSKPLPASMIDFRVQSVFMGQGGASAIIIPYKNARVDQQRLDDVVGPMNWQRKHYNGNANCIVSIWCDEKKIWVEKDDTGTESNTEAAKGLASDSFKRACFNWGIGRELYDYPVMFVKLLDGEFSQQGGKAKATNKLRPNDWVWFNQFSEAGELTYLAAKQNAQSKQLRYSYGVYNNG